MKISAVDNIDEIRDAWKEIGTNDSLPVFQSWQWNGRWCDMVLPSIRGGKVRSFVAQGDSGRVLAIVPCFGRPLVPGLARITELLGHRMSFLNDIVVRPGEDSGFVGDMIPAIRQLLGAGEIVHLRNLRASSPFTVALAAAGLAEVQCRRLIVRREEGRGDPLERLSRNQRKGLRWKENKLVKTQAATYHVATEAEAGAAFGRFRALHESRFSHRGEATILSGANMEFLGAIFVALNRAGKAEIIELRSGTTTIAALIGVMDGDRYYFVNSGFDMKYAQYSPMMLLLNQAMRRAFDELDCDGFELGPDYEAYKRIWNPDSEPGYTACISAAHVYSRLLTTAYRRAFRRALRRGGG